MAVISNADYGKLRGSIYTPGAGKEELKALTNLPTKAQFLAAMQAIEDYQVGTAFPAQKTLIQNALGTTINNTLAQKLIAGWYRFKLGQLGL